jgi:hypothetical protein
VLRKDFTRRFLDGQLLLYSLRGIEEKGRGPVIVCLDGSSSMMGDKEIWAKALTLTLLEIARRQRRLFRSICFSSAGSPLHILDLNPRERYEVETPNSPVSNAVILFLVPMVSVGSARTGLSGFGKKKRHSASPCFQS